MSRWPRGEAEIERLIANKQLQQVIGGQANGEHLLHKAFRTLETQVRSLAHARVSRERGSLGAGSSPASLEANNRAPDPNPSWTLCGV